MKLSSNDINRELMRLSGVKHAVLLEAFDVLSNELVCRWFADGRTTGFRIPAEITSFTEEAERVLQHALALWSESAAHPNPEAEIDRLKKHAMSSIGVFYAENWLND